ncbi:MULTISPECIES: zinc metalloprotease HtpX [Methanosphaera]|jgi:heat shock protein HtpX|uniref:zinc metalloprotease HtpX n=1 Tax=Methanosphaera TaxID=2316 RepID=UPI000DC2209A|nr:MULTISPECIES: zinc metalloprotease HtpX [Methanosphaera]MDO5821561.1 zinc metalloprotease HtpX [Methanosphaera sp.]MEE0488905.1 zinc metalloprotease HtpX [Methanosphaera stadtmanae]RAP48365.1 MAG: protease [Methanosphaera sp. DEW79]
MLENLKTVILLGFLSAVLVVVCGFIGSIFRLGGLGILLGLIFAIIMNFVSYFYSDKIALSSYNARIVTEAESPNLHRIVGELAANANILKPKVAIIETSTPNAFATGRNQQHAVVAVTTGILNILDEEELRGVISHELGHVKNRDILISSVAATVAGMIVAIASYGRYAMFFASDDDAGNIIGAVLMSIVGPIAATIVQLAISRSREYKADATGAQISGNPLALANALRKLEFGNINDPMMDAKSTDAHMFIMNPLSGVGSKLQNLFSTHPSTADRIQRLEEMANNHSY